MKNLNDVKANLNEKVIFIKGIYRLTKISNDMRLWISLLFGHTNKRIYNITRIWQFDLARVNTIARIRQVRPRTPSNGIQHLMLTKISPSQYWLKICSCSSTIKFHNPKLLQVVGTHWQRLQI